MSNFMNDCIHWDCGDTAPRAYGAFCRKRRESIGSFCNSSCPEYTNKTLEQARLAAVQDLVRFIRMSPERTLFMRSGGEISFNKYIESLRHVWPEAVEE